MHELVVFETEECKFTNKIEAGLEPQANIGRLQGTADHDVTKIIHDESVWTMRKNVAFVNRNRELHSEVMEEEINSLDNKCEKGWEEKYPMNEQTIKRKCG